MPIINVPGVGHVVLVDREQLRFKRHGRRFSAPLHLKAMAEAVPTPPAIFDWSNAETVKYPMLGNNQYGDCYYAAVAHGSQTFTGNSGTECQFDLNALIKRYLKLSGGDNGLDDATIMPEWTKGIVGPNGPRKIVEHMTVDPTDAAGVKLAMWRFYGLIWTCSLKSGWANNASPGSIWDAGQGHSVGGHAMYLTGCNASGNYDVRTWGISPPVQVTRRGLLSADSELIVAFSLDMFNANGLTSDGKSYEEMASIWASCGGPRLPASPFPPAPQPPGPVIDYGPNVDWD